MATKLNKTQTFVLQTLQENPDQKIVTYWPVRASTARAYLTGRHINFRIRAVETLHEMGYLEKQLKSGQTGFTAIYNYTLSEKGKAWQSNS